MNKPLCNAISALLIFMACSFHGMTQDQKPMYFDNDSIDSLKYRIDTNILMNTWQVGPPQKVIFDSAASIPNVLITDTLLPYPNNDSSVVYITIPNGWFYNIIVAIQWKQKLDMEPGKDGGLIEYKSKTDSVWRSVFNNPYVYKFYGFNSANAGILPNGDSAFTGMDSSWKDIWLCFDWNYYYDDMELRFTFVSDSNDTQQEGWMLDNFIAHMTFVHTVKEEEQEEYLEIFPTLTEGRVNIQAQRQQDYHIIEHMELHDSSGRLVRKWGRAPTKFFIDIHDLEDGMYFLTVTTNIKTETRRVQLKRN